MENVVKTYQKDIRVLKGISMDAKRGQITCLLGNNGSGKSTIIDLIAGLKSSNGGSIRVSGVDIS